MARFWLNLNMLVINYKRSSLAGPAIVDYWPSQIILYISSVWRVWISNINKYNSSLKWSLKIAFRPTVNSQHLSTLVSGLVWILNEFGNWIFIPTVGSRLKLFGLAFLLWFSKQKITIKKCFFLISKHIQWIQKWKWIEDL